MNVCYLCGCIPVPRVRGTMGKGVLCPCSAINSYRATVCRPLRQMWLVALLLCLCVRPAGGATLSGGMPHTEAGYTDGSGPEAAVCDSIETADCSETLRPTQLILPATLIAAGAFGVCNGWFKSVKSDLRDDMQHLRGNCYFHADDYLQYLPVTAGVTLGLAGVRSRHPLRERVAATAVAYAAMGVMVNVGKYTIRERRPDSSARNSFPSGHTATAFMGAEIVRIEYGPAYGIAAYTVGVGIAALRVYNERHWLNDVIAGAGIGILSARVGYWSLPLCRKVLGWQNVAVVPVVAPDGSGGGVAMSMSF